MVRVEDLRGNRRQESNEEKRKTNLSWFLSSAVALRLLSIHGRHTACSPPSCYPACYYPSPIDPCRSASVRVRARAATAAWLRGRSSMRVQPMAAQNGCTTTVVRPPLHAHDPATIIRGVSLHPGPTAVESTKAGKKREQRLGKRRERSSKNSPHTTPPRHPLPKPKTLLRRLLLLQAGVAWRELL